MLITDSLQHSTMAMEQATIILRDSAACKGHSWA